MSEQYDTIDFPHFTLKFHLSALEDTRGIGRVAREMQSSLRSISSFGCRISASVPVLYFFPSIHWCPTNLPERSVVMIHDTIPLSMRHFFHQHQDEWMYDFADIAIQAERILTISQSARSEIIKYMLVDAAGVDVVYNGVSDLGGGACIERVHAPSMPYVAYLGAGDRHKNLDIVLSALAMNRSQDIGLAVIGSACEDVVDRALIWGLDPSLVFPLGYLSDEVAGAVLAKAVALVMPSFHEGFGLPPFEAALMGVPSICSNRPAMNELLSEAAYFVDPFLAEDWLVAIRTLRDDRNLGRRLANAAANRARELTWERNAESLVGIFNQMAARGA